MCYSAQIESKSKWKHYVRHMEARKDEELQAILSERQPAYYEHRVAA